MFLTILTATYNRAHTLQRLYDSLQNQTNQNFKWIIVDDGSTDKTKDFVKKIQSSTKLSIKYIYKDNGGKHTAINEGIKYVETPLTFIVDSDDYLTQDAVESIHEKWEFYKERTDIGSFWFLQSNTKGKLTGAKFPQDEFISNYTDVMINKGNLGDKKSVYITELRKNNPFPVFEGEKFIGESTIHKKIGNDYKCVFVNKIIYKGDYLEGGLSHEGKKMRIRNPLGGMSNAKQFFTKDVKLSIRIKKIIIYCVYGFFAKIKVRNLIIDSGIPFLVIMLLPISYLFYKKWHKEYL